MDVIYIAPNKLDDFEGALKQMDENGVIESVIILMADNNKFDTNDIKPFLLQASTPIIGGIFPELIYNGERKNSGTILIPLSFKLNTQLFNLNEGNEHYMNLLEQIEMNDFESSNSLFVFADGLNANKDSFIEVLFNYFGINPTYIGGGAGSLSFKPFPCVITNSGLHANSAVIGFTSKNVSLGVAHGWESISDPLKVTKANGNIIESINYTPAFDMYKEVVEKHSGRSFADNDFFDIAKSYPLGITKIDAEMVVRDPYMVSDKSIHVVDVIKEGEYVNILHGDINSLLAGAKKAKDIALAKQSDGMNKNAVFCIDCISRVLFMQESFAKELEILGEDTKVNGVLSIGEIANSEESFLEIYNKTVVVGIW